jgi:hypothetical protein
VIHRERLREVENEFLGHAGLIDKNCIPSNIIAQMSTAARLIQSNKELLIAMKKRVAQGGHREVDLVRRNQLSREAVVEGVHDVALHHDAKTIVEYSFLLDVSEWKHFHFTISFRRADVNFEPDGIGTDWWG